MDMFYSDSEPDDPARPSVEDLDESMGSDAQLLEATLELDDEDEPMTHI